MLQGDQTARTIPYAGTPPSADYLATKVTNKIKTAHNDVAFFIFFIDFS